MENYNKAPCNLHHNHRTKPAVVFEKACKSYTSSGKEVPVLSNFYMTIQQGAIYSLLGSSGCGKTTVLSCIVGLKRLDAGCVQVFGGLPGSKNGVTGRKVGYMPQELSLCGEFTINEVFQYFGTIFAMSRQEILETTELLIKFLDLPHSSRRISTLSGGQKRRVSLAACLLHNPQLLILDEPTVGVDPVLRERIWTYLIQLVSRGTTVLITTHYIEEARKSDAVGLMRNGRLLVEESPNVLMQKYNASLLEDVVLTLCTQDSNQDQDSEYSSNKCPSTTTTSSETIHPTNDVPLDEKSAYDHSDYFHHLEFYKNVSNGVKNEKDVDAPISQFRESTFRLEALVRRNFCVMIRNLPYLLFVLFLPAIQMIILCLTIGNPPHPLKIGVVNYDSELCNSGFDYLGCAASNLSCRYLQSLPKDIIHLVSFKNENLAKVAVQRAEAWGYLTFPHNFSQHILDRFISGNFATNETLDGSTILFDLDLSNAHIGFSMKRVFYDGLRTFIHGLLRDCEYDSKLGDPPIKYNPPIYGTEDSSFREFTAPSTLLGILFFFPICSSSINLILDKKQGTLERSLVAGVKAWEIMLSYIITEGCVLVLQSNFSFLILILAFSIEVKGSIALAISLATLVGVCGLSMGFLFASFCNELLEAIVLAMGSFFPNFLLSGMIWPMEGMPVFLQYFSYVLPCTLAGEALRSIVSRGWGFSHPSVWAGFASVIAWICFYWGLNLLVQRLLARKRVQSSSRNTSTVLSGTLLKSKSSDLPGLLQEGSWKVLNHE